MTRQQAYACQSRIFHAEGYAEVRVRATYEGSRLVSQSYYLHARPSLTHNAPVSLETPEGVTEYIEHRLRRGRVA